ncbi:MAG: PocR ligand-binding domain-containing protein [Treponema sp.]|nr:PocR ligand-binding domain-containing protein [Treponema sp.]
MLGYTLIDLIDIQSLQIIQNGFDKFTGLKSLVTDADFVPITKGGDFSEFIDNLFVKNVDAEKPVINKNILSILHSGKTITLKNSSGLCDAATPIMLENDLLGYFICGPKAESNQQVSDSYISQGSQFLGAIAKALSQMAYSSYLSLNNSHAMEQSAFNASSAITETALRMKMSMQEWVELLTEALDCEKVEDIKSQIEQILVFGNDINTAVNDSVQNIHDKTSSTHLIETEYNLNHLLSHFIERAKKVEGNKNLSFSYNVDKSVPQYIFGDNERVSQIVYTLFKSSAMRMEEGSAHLEISAQKNSYATILTLKFTDSTQGFNDDELEALQMFIETGDQSYLEESKIIGMGYRTLNKIIQQMFGQINFEILSDTQMEFLIKIPQLEVEVEELGA